MSESGSLTSVADCGLPSSMGSLKPCQVELVRIPVTLDSPEDVDVDNNGNKLQLESTSLITTTAIADSSDEASDVADSCVVSDAVSGGVSAPLVSKSVTLTPLKQLMTSSAPSPSRDSTSTPSKLRSSLLKSLTPVKSQVTPSKSPRSKVTKSKSPAAAKSSTPSKSPVSSPRQRSLMEMFSRSSAFSAVNTSTENSSSLSETSDRQPATELFEAAEKLDTTEHRQLNVEVLVEDSQMAETSPVRVVDTQESLFVDETPPKCSDVDVAAAAHDEVEDGTQMKASDSCDADSSSDGEVLQQTVVHVDTDDDIPSATGATSDVDIKSAPTADTVGTEFASHSQASSVNKVVSVDSSDSPTAISASTVIKMSHDADSHTQRDVIDLTQISNLDHTQNSVIDLTQVNTLEHTQPSVMDHIQTSSLDCAQLPSDSSQHSVTGDGQVSGMNDEGAVVADSEDDMPLNKMTQSHDAIKFLSSDDDVPLVHLKPSEDEVDAEAPACHDKTVANYVRSRRRKNAVHSTIEGRVSRRTVETRPARLTLRTRSVQRITDKLVNAGAKKVDVLPSQLPGMRPRGRPKKTKSADLESVEVRNGQSELETRLRSHVPHRSSAKRTCKSVWMRVAAAELNIAPTVVDETQNEDVVEGLRENSLAEGDVSQVSLVEGTGQWIPADDDDGQVFSENISDADSQIKSGIENCDGEKITELQPEVDRTRDEEMAVFEDGAKVVNVGEVNDGVEELASGEVTEAAELNTDVEPTPCCEVLANCESSGKLDSDTDLGQETLTIIECSVVEPPDETAGEEQRVVVVPPTEMTTEEERSSGSSTSEIITEDIIADVLTTDTDIQDTSGSHFAADEAAVPVSISGSPADDGMTGVDVVSSHTDTTTTGGDSNKEVVDTSAEVDKTTPTADGSGECQWKVPTSSVTKGHSTTPVDAPPETPTSISRHRFSRGSLMLERAKQLRHSATKSAAVERGSEDEMNEQSPSGVDRRGGSGLSKLKVFSPAASPSAGILRKRQLSADSSAGSGHSPSSPSSRVCVDHVCCF